MTNPIRIKIDNVEYVRADAHKTVYMEGKPLVMVRTAKAGVHFGYLESRNGNEVLLLNSRRVYYWAGAATLSQLANSGTTKPDLCKFPEVLPTILLLGVIEIIPISNIAKHSLDSVKVWKLPFPEDYGHGSGAGDGSGRGADSGSGYGAGAGDGSGYGSGNGTGSGTGSGDGIDEGAGADNGTGFGDGSGYGSGYGSRKGTGSGTGLGSGMGASDGTGYDTW